MREKFFKEIVSYSEGGGKRLAGRKIKKNIFERRKAQAGTVVRVSGTPEVSPCRTRIKKAVSYFIDVLILVR